jgi:heptosyltransferase-2
MNIAVFWPNWVGDAVMATPAVRALRDHFRKARLVHVLRPYVAAVLEGSPWPESRIYVDRHAPVALRREHIDLAVLFPNSFRTALIAWLGRCRRRVGYRRYARGILLTDLLEPIRSIDGRFVPSPVLDAYNRIVSCLGCPEPSPRLELYTTPSDESAADIVWESQRLYRRQGVVCLNPGAAFGAAKHWPVASFARLAQRLADELGYGVLVLCGPAERTLANEIVTRAERKAVRSLADQPLSLGLTKACVRRSDLLVTTDSGPRHFAAAFDRPVITLFGPTHIEWTETYHPKAVHMQKKVDCGPCQLRTCPLDHRCMTLLTADEVFDTALTLLAANTTAQQAG